MSDAILCHFLEMQNIKRCQNDFSLPQKRKRFKRHLKGCILKDVGKLFFSIIILSHCILALLTMGMNKIINVSENKFSGVKI
jgi:hypothetical protein